MPYLRAFLPLLEKLNRTRSFTLRVVGAVLESDGLNIECLQWAPETEAALLAQCDIGIMPLADSLWEDGKCGYKLIQYMAAGLPTVASPVAANREITLQGETGFLASTKEEWQSALITFLDDPALCKRMGEAGRARIHAHYALDVWGPRYADMLENAAGAPRKTKTAF